MTLHTVHNVQFEIDTCDWSDRDAQKVAESELIDGLNRLSQRQVLAVASACKTIDDQIRLSSEGADVWEPIAKIERAAFKKATNDWCLKAVRYMSGHNCEIYLADLSHD